MNTARLMRTIGDYHLEVITRASIIVNGGMVTGVRVADLRRILDRGSHYPVTSQIFAEVRSRAWSFIAAADEALAGRGVRVATPGQEADDLRDAISAFCRHARGAG